MDEIPLELATAENIPHTCLYCQREVVQPVLNEDFGPRWSFKFQTDGEGAKEAASQGCVLWKWYIRAYLDKDGWMRKSPYIDGVGRKRSPPDQCYFYIFFENGGYKEEPLQLDEVNMGQVYIYPEGSAQSDHDSFRMIAEEVRLIFHPF